MSNAKSICLCMIVKDEEETLPRSLPSVKPFITHYCIVDTGSTDKTKEVIAKELEGIPGVVHDRPWVNWGHNRSEAINLAKECGCEWLFLLDADEELKNFKIPENLDPKRSYWIDIYYGGIIYSRPNLIHTSCSWRYIGATHEYLMCDERPPMAKLPGYLETDHPRINKSSERFKEDIRLLEEALKTEPDNARYVFYLAQSYKDAGDPEKAIELYKKRSAMGGWAEEIYISLLRVAQLSEGRRTFPEVAAAYTIAHEYRPSRAGETLSNFARYCTWWANGTPYPVGDVLFVDASAYKINPWAGK